MACFGRFGAEPYAELRAAAAEQMKITELRMAKLLDAARGSGSSPMGPPHGAGGIDAHPTAGPASAASAPSRQEEATSAVSFAAEPADAAARRAGRLRAHFLPPPGGHGLVASPTAASPGVRCLMGAKVQVLI